MWFNTASGGSSGRQWSVVTMNDTGKKKKNKSANPGSHTRSRIRVRKIARIPFRLFFTLRFPTNDRGFESRQGLGFSSSSPCPDRLWAHPASYPVGTRSSFSWGKMAGAWSWPPPSSAEVKLWAELYLHSPNTPSWRGAQLKHRDDFTFTLSYYMTEMLVSQINFESQQARFCVH
jgi:hypothetical protein